MSKENTSAAQVVDSGRSTPAFFSAISWRSSLCFWLETRAYPYLIFTSVLIDYYVPFNFAIMM